MTVTWLCSQVTLVHHDICHWLVLPKWKCRMHSVYDSIADHLVFVKTSLSGPSESVSIYIDSLSVTHFLSVFCCCLPFYSFFLSLPFCDLSLFYFLCTFSLPCKCGCEHFQLKDFYSVLVFNKNTQMCRWKCNKNVPAARVANDRRIRALFWLNLFACMKIIFSVP